MITNVYSIHTNPTIKTTITQELTLYIVYQTIQNKVDGLVDVYLKLGKTICRFSLNGIFPNGISAH
jgi:hypothetical protein